MLRIRRDITQAVSRRLLTAKDRILSPAIPCEFCGG
jgi:hypothetical protein